MLDKMFKKALKNVEKPARYIGSEYNATIKSDFDFSFALCFPDVYEIGMSHIGAKILYNILNDIDGVACERAYAPWTDMEREMRAHGIPMFSLETKKPLREFDVIGFSLLYELGYTNILTMLELAGIPFYSAMRGEDMPLVVCGGPCVCNPEPIAPFFDCVMYGDGEELIKEFTLACLDAKKRGLSKRETLNLLQKIEGVYIPSFYEPIYDGDGIVAINKVEKSAPDRVTRRILKDLDSAMYIGKPLVPHIAIVHDRVPLEIFRGCTRGCRFCQAGFIYRPVREREMGTLLSQAHMMTDCTGYDEISLFSLSSGDYSQLYPLVDTLVDNFSDKRVSLSFPSLRIDSYVKQSLERMKTVRKTGLTFAPEAGTQRLRDVINKGVTEEDLLSSVKDAFMSGWSSVKLYFMIGLPTETEDDVRGIAELAKKVKETYYSVPRELREKAPTIGVSVSSFVPKPVTPFQWVAQNTAEELMKKQAIIKQELAGVRGIELSYHDVQVSTLESVFARGDRRLADAIVYAYEHGARFDAWDELFKPDVWSEAFEHCKINRDYVAHRDRSTDELLPWSVMDPVVTKEYLEREYKRSLVPCVTKDCREGCNGCFGDRNEDYCVLQKR